MEKPEFPMVRGAELISAEKKDEIAEKAWAQSNGNALAFRQLCAEHVRGDIDLFAETGTAIRSGRSRAFAPGSDQYTATGGETIDRHVASTAARPSPEAVKEPIAPGSAGETWAEPKPPEPEPAPYQPPVPEVPVA